MQIRLLQAHVVFDGVDAFDTTSNFNCPVNIFTGADETTQLHDTLEGFDINLA